MEDNKKRVLRLVAHYDGEVSEYPIHEFGHYSAACELVADGLLVRVTRPGDLDLFRLTPAGRNVLKSLTEP